MLEIIHNPDPGVELATAIAVGGALTTEDCLPVYEGHLGQDPYSKPEELFFPNPPENVRNHKETCKRLGEFAEKAYSRNGGQQRLVVVGHSFGGMLALKLGLERPDIVASVKSMAGLQEGYRDTIGVKAVQMLVGGDKEAFADGKHGSHYMQAFHEQAASEWSSKVSLTLDAALADVCFPFPQGLNIKLPEGQAPTKRLVAGPQFVFLMNALRGMGVIPRDVDLLTSPFTPWITEHILLPALPVENYDTTTLRARIAESEKIKPLSPPTPALTPELDLVA